VNAISKWLMVLALLAGPVIAVAGMVTETFTGTITGGSTIDVQGLFFAPLTNLNGDTYTATYVINNPIIVTNNSSYYNLYSNNPPYLLFTINGKSFSNGIGSSVYLSGDGTSDAVSGVGTLSFLSGTGTVTNSVIAPNGSFFASPLSGLAFNYTVNPATVSSSGTLNLLSIDGGLYATLDATSVTFASSPLVPLPAAGWLLLSALGGLGLLMRRSQHQSHLGLAAI
jgi:hypothetical protein